MAQITDAQWNMIRPWFDPARFFRRDILVTGPATPIYNCIAYSLGYTDRWINPPQPRATFIQLYANHGLYPAPFPQGIVDGYERNGQMTHGSRLNGKWESKLGQSLRIFHARNSLTGPQSAYGEIVVSFNRTRPRTLGLGHADEDVEASAEASLEDVAPYSMISPSEHARQSVAQTTGSLKDHFPTLHLKFEFRYTRWVDTWDAPERFACQNSTDFANGKEWDQLVALGPRIIPYVIAKLHDPEHQFAVELYNQLQADEQHKVDRSDFGLYYDLTNHAAWIINDYARLIDHIDTEAANWKAHQASVSYSSSSRDYLAHSSYDSLLAVGKSNIALIMDKYAQDQDGWWHELLFEIENGSKPSSSTYQRPELYQQWKAQFEATTDTSSTPGL
ncbi:hypothetical protein DFH27DRAFT_598692 [Peziza echinospora]|nr:hypothetical protein DFH27DRAFT_598692 [Peziza echinospora]